MTVIQDKIHKENHEIVARIVQKWRRYRFLSEADRQKLMIALQMMRMVCDNSYLVDHHSDHGIKTEEAITLLGEIFERPDSKVVVFSQWLRMHELLVRRFKKRSWDHVVFHGGVPGVKRTELVDRFRDDPRCRTFLATDAGGVGLNFQHASVVMNLDLPWNPAVLEQRIGRVHRLGQRQPVRVINFVAKGTIEEGMLSVLQFKKSLFAGVLDGGEKDVFIGGSRFNKFMETVEAATTSIPESMVEDASQLPKRTAVPMVAGIPLEGETDEEAAAAASEAYAPSDPWAGLLQVGMALVQQITGASPPAAPESGSPSLQRASLVQTLVTKDERTGESYLKLPVPPPEFIDQALRTVAGVLESMRK